MPNVSAALALATELHAGQTRKGGSIPYIVHPIGVAAVVAQYGGDNTLICAALFHDVLEDCGVDAFARVQKAFGADVSNIVFDCTRPRGESRTTYLRRIVAAPGDLALTVALADKLDNARAIARDALLAGGPSVWDRFTGGESAVRAYYANIDTVLCKEGGRRGGALAVLGYECHMAISFVSTFFTKGE
jgi:(p)ppGpp synthase/HD superfamily hydrolase